MFAKIISTKVKKPSYSRKIRPAKYKRYSVSVLICVVVANKLLLDKYDVQWMADESIFKMKKEITSQLWNIVGEKLGKGQTYGCSKSVPMPTCTACALICARLQIMCIYNEPLPTPVEPIHKVNFEDSIWGCTTLSFLLRCPHFRGLD